MALSDLFSFFTGEAKEKYNEKPVDPAKARKPLLRGIETAKRQFQADNYKAPNRWFSVKNSVVAFHPKLDGRTLTINGVDENHMPSERFEEFLDLMKAEVEAGEFDEVIAAHGKGNVDVHIGKAQASSGAGRNYSPEGKLNIALNNRYNKALSDSDLQAKLIAAGYDADLVKAAIKKRKKG